MVLLKLYWVDEFNRRFRDFFNINEHSDVSLLSNSAPHVRGTVVVSSD